MYDVILDPAINDVNKDGDTINPAVIYVKSLGKFYGRMHIDIVIGAREYVPSPTDDDITITGNDAVFDLNVYGTPGGAKVEEGTLKYEIMAGEADPGDVLDRDQIQTMIGARQFDMTAKVFKNGQLKSNQTGTISNSSEIEIYD